MQDSQILIGAIGVFLTMLGMLFAGRNHLDSEIRDAVERSDALRAAMRAELLAAMTRITEDVERLKRDYVRREEMIALDARLMACVVRMEAKMDRLIDGMMAQKHDREAN